MTLIIQIFNFRIFFSSCVSIYIINLKYSAKNKFKDIHQHDQYKLVIDNFNPFHTASGSLKLKQNKHLNIQSLSTNDEISLVYNN